MEKIFTNNSIWKKIVVAILIVMAFQILVSAPIVKAAEEEVAQDGDNLVYKGVLARPITSFVITVGDGIINILHSQIMGQEKSLQVISMGEDPGWFWAVLGGIVAAIAVVAAVALALTGVGALIEAIGASIAVASIGAGTVLVGLAGGTAVAFAIHDAQMPETLYLPTYSYSAEEIFKGNILLFNINFFETKEKEINVCYSYESNEDAPDKKEVTVETSTGERNVQVDTTEAEKNQYNHKKTKKCSLAEYENLLKSEGGPYNIEYYYYLDKDKDNNEIEIKTSPQNSALFLTGIISKWYVAIRNICIVAMLSVLIYVGIRMMLTTVASDKAKYKEMLKDWLVGLCLLFIMHYIMAFSVTIVEKITQIINTSIDKNLYMGIIADKEGKLSKAVEGTDLAEYIKDGYLYYPVNLMGYLRLEIQKLDIEQTGGYLGFAVCFLILVIFTVMFTFTYLKRLLYMAFLTLISPLVALTYCIDKLNDGQSQGFNMWLKEYIFNLLIQPMHLLLYFILVSSAIELAGRNVLYSLVALGFMLPAEKLLRSMFGFEKAKTPPVLGGPLGTSLMMQGISSLSKLAKGGRSPQDKPEKNRTVDTKEGEEAFLGQNVDMHQALSGNNHEQEDDIDFRNSTGDVADVTEGGQNEQQRMPTEIASEMESLDIRQQELNELFEGEDETTLSDSDLIYRDQLQSAIDNRREELLAANQGLRLQHVENPEPLDERNEIENPYESSNSPHKNHYIRRAVGAAVKTRAKSMFGIGSTPKKTLKNNAKRLAGAIYKGGSGIAKRLPGAMIGTATGVTAAALGGAAAIASGDEKNFATAMGAAIGAGYSVGQRISGTTTTKNLDEDTKQALESARETYNTDEHKQKEREKQIERARENDVNRIKAERELGSAEAADRFMSDGGDMSIMMNKGVTNFKHMLAIEQGINNGEFENIDEGLGTYAMLQRFGGKSPEYMDEKGVRNLDKTILQIISPDGRETARVIDRRNRIKTNMNNLYSRIND